MPEFEWDPEKAPANRQKHRIDFTAAALVWSDPLHRVSKTDIPMARSAGKQSGWWEA